MTVPVGLLLVLGYLQWQSVREYRAALDWVTHTRVVLRKLEAFLSSMNDAEAGRRGYLLAHEDSFLGAYEDAVNQGHDQLQTIRLLTSDNPLLQQRLDQLEPLVNTELAKLSQSVALEKNLDHAAAVKLFTSSHPEESMDQIRTLVSTIHDSERSLLQQREEAYLSTAYLNSNVALLFVIVDVGFIAGIFLLLRRLERMEEMIKICAWSKLIEYEGEWISIEDYLHRRFKMQISHGMSDAEANKMLQLIQEEKR